MSSTTEKPKPDQVQAERSQPPAGPLFPTGDAEQYAADVDQLFTEFGGQF